MKKVKIKCGNPTFDKREYYSIRKVLKSGRLSGGPKLKEFEESWKSFLGTNSSIIACNSGTSALHLILRSIGIRGTAVFVPSMSFFASISPVIIEGGYPVFIDVNSECNMDPSHLQYMLRQYNPSAVIIVHLFGNPCSMNDIQEVLRNKRIFLIEDCAQAHGVTYSNRLVGTFGDFSFWSFYATKLITTGGEGGAILSTHEDHSENISKIRAHGMIDYHTHQVLGYNFRMTEIASAIGLEQIKKLPFFVNTIQRQAKIYEDSISDKFLLCKPSNAKSRVYFGFPIVLSTFKELNFVKTSLLSEGIETRYRYTDPLYKQPVCRPFVESNLYLPKAEFYSKRVLRLPIGPHLKDKDIKYVVSVLNHFLEIR